MAYPNFKKGLKMTFGPLGVKFWLPIKNSLLILLWFFNFYLVCSVCNIQNSFETDFCLQFFW
jgi:hypothetical protein